jgi:hypothetical protein
MGILPSSSGTYIKFKFPEKQSFGLPEDHSLILKGVQYLLAEQNPDGSWGDTEAEDIYERYHPTWTAIDGLREYAWRGKRLCFPELAPLLKIQGKRRR